MKQASADGGIRVWDPLIRLFHWSLVGFFTVAYLTEDEFFNLHSYSGYAVALLLGFRLVWGLIGTRYARFTSFVTGPRTVLSYLKALVRGKARHYVGHNPAGAAMILLLIASLLLTTFSGMSIIAADGQGPLAHTFVAAYSGEWVEDIHEFFANFTVFLVALHVAGVLVSSLLHRENLVRAMITGRKPQTTTTSKPGSTQ